MVERKTKKINEANVVEAKITADKPKEVRKENKVEEKQDEKIQELKIELLKSTAKRRKIKKDIARLLTIQSMKMKMTRESKQTKKTKITSVKGEKK